MTARDETFEVWRGLRPGDRVRLRHHLKVGFRGWECEVTGTVVSIDRRRDGCHYQRNSDDKVFADLIVLRKDSGELTTVAIDPFCELRRIPAP
ncbi:MAG: hypothetical protein FJ297_07570 [Planctomycetes bacterium]|nr:hypothetical protein [Planctomycetota bacterium]